MDSTGRRLQEIFRTVFELPANADVAACARSNTAGWDSMAHITLVVAIEEEFGVVIDVADSLNLTSYDSARRYLAAAGA